MRQESFIEQEEHKGYRIEIHQDQDAQNPRTEFDGHLGHMVCWHKRYDLGDEQPRESADGWILGLAESHDELLPGRLERLEDLYSKSKFGGAYGSKEWADHWKEHGEEKDEAIWQVVNKHYVFLPLYLYDHSGITMKTSGFSCPWDSGQVGWIYASRTDAKNEFNKKKWSRNIEAKTEKILIQEVKTYDDYLTGNVYGYEVYDPEGELVDSCWGFYGDKSYCLSEAMGIVDYYAPRREVEIAEAHLQEIAA